MNVFIDSDVVISSLISQTGGAHYLLNKSPITPIISSISLKELKKVALRLNIDQEKLAILIYKRFKVIPLKQSISSLKIKYSPYVFDINDAHIVAGAKKAKINFLVTYNLKHFQTTKLKDDLKIQVFTPALFMQYLRSQEEN